jgi:hypothetical protein
VWQDGGLSNATINRVCNTLRRAFTLARRARKIYVVPFIPRLEEEGRRGKYTSTLVRATSRRSWRDSRRISTPSCGLPTSMASGKDSWLARNGGSSISIGVPRILWTVASIPVTEGAADVHTQECRASSHDV